MRGGEGVPNSYMVVSLETGLAVLEFFNAKLARHINKEKYEVVTAAEYLAEFNRRIALDR